MEARGWDTYREILDPCSGATAVPQSIRQRLAADARGVRTAAWGLLFPPHCMACGTPLLFNGNGAICGGCAQQVQWIGADRCRRCGDRVGEGRGAVEECPACAARPPVYVSGSCAVACYGDPLRALILGLKFGAGMQAVPLLARLLAHRIRTTGLADGATGSWALVPVPMHRVEFIRRGFNQAAEVAELAARDLGLPMETRLLAKTRSTRPQATLGQEARRENLLGAFEARSKFAIRYAKGGILLVDDVMTTGATAGECAKALRAAGVGEIRMAVIARG